MIKSFSNKILRILIKNNAVEKRQEALVLFGIEQGLITMLEIVSMLVTGFLMRQLMESVVILITFTLIRVYAGGYHAKTPTSCLFKTWLLFVGVLVSLKNMYFNIYTQCFFMLFNIICIFCFCPLESEQKKLKKCEKDKYRKKAIVNSLLVILLYGVFVLLKLNKTAMGCFGGTLMANMLLLLGVYKNTIKIGR